MHVHVHVQFVHTRATAVADTLTPAHMRRVNASASCFAGSSPGVWRTGGGPEWQLLPSIDGGPSAGCAPLVRYAWVDPTKCGKRVPSPVPNAGPTNMGTCAQHDEPRLVADLADVSILMVGDSTSAQLLWHTCEAFRSKTRAFVPINATLHGPLKRYTHRLRSLDNHACGLTRGLTLGSFSHYGATGPPYWVFAYPLPPWLSDTSLGMVREDMPRFRALTARGEDPTLIVASSSLGPCVSVS